MELYAYHSNNDASLKILTSFLNSVTIINIDDKVKIKAIELRKKTKIKLPDCIIAASALAYNIPLITADKGFKKIEDIDLILYANI